MINRQNWLDTKDFLAYHEGTLQNDPLTVQRLRVALRPLLEWADSRPLGDVRNLVPTFPAYITAAKVEDTGKPFATQSRVKTLQIARQFFTFAKSEYPGRYKAITESWIQTLQPSKRNAAHTRLKNHSHYTLEDVLKIAALPTGTLQERRDIAGVCFLFLSGMRVGAFCSLPIDCVSIAESTVYQLPEKGVLTKNRKAAVTYLLRIPELLQVVTAWDSLVNKELSQSDLWYPVMTRDGERFERGRIANNHRRENFSERLKVLCYRAGIAYQSPHKLRHGHVVYALKNVRDMAGFKAVSQNVMHSSLTITDSIYGGLTGEDVQKAINGITGQANQINENSQAGTLQAVSALLEMLKSNPAILEELLANTSKNG